MRLFHLMPHRSGGGGGAEKADRFGGPARGGHAGAPTASDGEALTDPLGGRLRVAAPPFTPGSGLRKATPTAPASVRLDTQLAAGADALTGTALCSDCLSDFLVPGLARWATAVLAGSTRSSAIRPGDPTTRPPAPTETRDAEFGAALAPVVHASIVRYFAPDPVTGGCRPPTPRSERDGTARAVHGSSGCAQHPSAGDGAAGAAGAPRVVAQQVRGDAAQLAASRFLRALSYAYAPARFLGHCMEFGFGLELGSARPSAPPPDPGAVEPFRMEVAMRARIWGKLQKECSAGRLTILPALPATVEHVLPIWAVPKGTGGDIRVVHDGTHPKGRGLNAHMALDAQWHRQYDGVATLADLVVRALPVDRAAADALANDLVAIKLDVKAAFRALPLREREAGALVHVVADPKGAVRYVRDEAVFFGSRMSADLFVRVASVLRALYRAAGLDANLLYVDDTAIVVRRRLALPALVVAASCMRALALPVAWDKLEIGSALVVLGTLVDLPSLALALPEDKRLDRLARVRKALAAGVIGITEWRSLVGKLQHAALLSPPARLLMRPLYRVMRRAGTATSAAVDLSRHPPARAALQDWDTLLCGPWPRLRFAKAVAWSCLVVTDASDIALGAASRRWWGWAPAAAVPRLDEGASEPQDAKGHIARLELAAVTLALAALEGEVQGVILPVFTDNLNVLGWLNTLSCAVRVGERSPALLDVPVLLTWAAEWAHRHDVVLRPFYVPTADNILADAISRTSCRPTAMEVGRSSQRFLDALHRPPLIAARDLPGWHGELVTAVTHHSRPVLPRLPLHEPATQILSAAIRGCGAWLPERHDFTDRADMLRQWSSSLRRCGRWPSPQPPNSRTAPAGEPGAASVSRLAFRR